MRFKGRVVLVTGGSRGIGREIALHFATEGANVAITYEENSKAAQSAVESVRSLGVVGRAYKVDVSDHNAVRKTVEEVLADFVDINILVNNAGIFERRLVRDMSETEWDRMVKIDLKGVFNTCKFVSIRMMERRSGRIINIGSFAGKRGSAGHAHYAAAKAGVLAFTRSLARELASYGVTVNAVNPGRIDTEMLTPFRENEAERWKTDTPLRRLGRPSDVASTVLFLASDGAEYITGETIEVNGGLLMD
jgi:3-oxoacyl-[acyl-carrier protein] reductase